MQFFSLMSVGMILSGALLWLTRTLEAEPRELLYILFWFMGENVCDHLFLSGYDLRRERRLAGRLASIRVIFSESYKAPDYTKSDVERLYSEIEKDVRDTFQKREDDMPAGRAF